MKNVYYVMVHRDKSGIDRFLCRKCAAKFHSWPKPGYAVGMTDVCEHCNAQQIAFPIGAIIERRRVQKGTRTVAGVVRGIMGPGLLMVDWIHTTRIGGDGWTRNTISFPAAKLASPEIEERAKRYIERVGLR